MARTQYYVAATLDGFIADPDGGLSWLFQFDGAEGIAEHYQAFLAQTGAIAMGAATYEFLLANEKTWPYQVPTWVFTHRDLPRLGGGDIRFTRDDVGSVDRQLRETAGERNVWLVGGGNLVAQFVERGLLDEIHLGLAPVVLGKGIPLLPASLRTPLTLTGTRTFGRGFVELRYDVTPRSTTP
jgi:dihydrofolate reductase